MIEELEHQDVFICDDEEDILEDHSLQFTSPAEQTEKATVKEEPEIFVFDDDDDNQYEEEIVCSKHTAVNMKEHQKRLSQQEYQSKCSQLQDKIIFTNMTNFRNNIIKPQKNYFEQAKEKRRESQLQHLQKRRSGDSSKFIQKVEEVKCNFVPAVKPNNYFSDGTPTHRPTNMEESLNGQIITVTKEDFLSAEESKYSLKGAVVNLKSNLLVKEVKERNILKVSNFRQFMFTQLQPNYQIFVLIKRTQNGLINSTYKFYFQQNNKFIMACQKQGFSKYVFSSSEVHISQDHISYLAKMESNFSGTDFNVYDSGEEFNKTKMMENYKKQLAYASYSKESGEPQRFETYITTCDNKSTDFTIKDKSGNVIYDRWNKGNKKKISKLTTKRPSYDSAQCNYKLDFRGLAGIPSTKNFILESEDYPEALIFGRQDKDSYLLRVKSPFSLIQGLAICMSSIHYKIF